MTVTEQCLAAIAVIIAVVGLMIHSEAERISDELFEIRASLDFERDQIGRIADTFEKQSETKDNDA